MEKWLVFILFLVPIIGMLIYFSFTAGLRFGKNIPATIPTPLPSRKGGSRGRRKRDWHKDVWRDGKRVAEHLNSVRKQEIDGEWYAEVSALDVLGKTSNDSWRKLREKYSPEIRFLPIEAMKKYGLVNKHGRLFPGACIVEINSVLKQTGTKYELR